MWMRQMRRAYRYLHNRLEHVDYRGALQKGLLTGPGQVESEHFHVLQARLKRAGNWWSSSGIKRISVLQLSRAN